LRRNRYSLRVLCKKRITNNKNLYYYNKFLAKKTFYIEIFKLRKGKEKKKERKKRRVLTSPVCVLFAPKWAKASSASCPTTPKCIKRLETIIPVLPCIIAT
jgi:hypothetical protein